MRNTHLQNFYGWFTVKAWIVHVSREKIFKTYWWRENFVFITLIQFLFSYLYYLLILSEFESLYFIFILKSDVYRYIWDKINPVSYQNLPVKIIIILTVDQCISYLNTRKNNILSKSIFKYFNIIIELAILQISYIQKLLKYNVY